MAKEAIILNDAVIHTADMPCYNLRAIGLLESVFREKNGTPRQGAVVPASRARLQLSLDNNCGHALEGLEGYTHVWIVFMFSLNNQLKTNYKVKPPRMGGGSTGVFSTRAPHRPNPIGLSLAKLDSIDLDKGIVNFTGVDLVHGTPILDIKPYLPEHDAPTGDATVPTWVTTPGTPNGFEIKYTEEALIELTNYVTSGKLQFYNNIEDIRAVIYQVLINEPRSNYRKRKHAEATSESDRSYGFCIDVLNINCRYEQDNSGVTIFHIEDWTDRYTDSPGSLAQ